MKYNKIILIYILLLLLVYSKSKHIRVYSTRSQISKYCFNLFFIYVNHLNKLIHYNESDFQHYIYKRPIYHIIPVYPFARYNKTLYICWYSTNIYEYILQSWLSDLFWSVISIIMWTFWKNQFTRMNLSVCSSVAKTLSITFFGLDSRAECCRL